MANYLNSTRLDRPIRIERRTAAPGPMGGERFTYSLRCRVFAEVKQSRGREQFLAERFEDMQFFDFLIRYRTDIEPTDRVVWKGVAYDIQSLSEVGRNQGLMITAKKPGAEVV